MPTASVPGGDISPAVLRSADTAGTPLPVYLRALAGAPSRGRVLGAGTFLSPRSITSADEIARLAEFQGWTGKLLVRGLKAIARRSLPPLYRLYVSRDTREWQERTL